jgi:hypothetical protein
MKTRIILALAVVLILAIALTSGASNMGFKLSQTLTSNVSKYVSLPYYNSFATQKAAYLRNDIMAAAGYSTPYPVGVVNVYNWNGTAWQRYGGSGTGGQVNFDLAPGIGYQIASTVDVSNWVIVGSHNPSTRVPFSANVSKYVSVPYHTTASKAALLRNELMAAAGYSTPYPVGVVNVYNWNGTAWQRYGGSGTGGQVNFDMTPGLGYQVASTVDITTGGGWLPAHY